MHAPDFGGKPYEGVICQGFPPQSNNQTLEWSLEGCKVPMVKAPASSRADGTYCVTMQYEWLVHILYLFRM